MSPTTKTRIKIAITVLSVLLPVGFILWTVLPEGPTNGAQQELLGEMIGKLLLFILFMNLAIWGLGLGGKPKT